MLVQVLGHVRLASDIGPREEPGQVARVDVRVGQRRLHLTSPRNKKKTGGGSEVNITQAWNIIGNATQRDMNSVVVRPNSSFSRAPAKVGWRKQIGVCPPQALLRAPAGIVGAIVARKGHGVERTWWSVHIREKIKKTVQHGPRPRQIPDEAARLLHTGWQEKRFWAEVVNASLLRNKQTGPILAPSTATCYAHMYCFS